MTKVLIVANFKSKKNLAEQKVWIDEFLKNSSNLKNVESKDVIICPSFPYLFSFNSAFSGTNIKIGAQTLSPFDEGSHTGEVNAKQIKDFADFVIVGHSEERNLLNESDELFSEKVKLAIKYLLTPIFCVQDKGTFIPEGTSIVAYEPVFAIGTGTPDTPESADAIAGTLKSNKKDLKVLYGGSVTSQNVKSFTTKTNIDGVLVGGASLDPDEFIQIIQNA